MKRKNLLFFSLFNTLLLCQFSLAQLGFEYDNSIPVFKSGVQLKYPWAGGLNYAQISDFDFDFDGDLDLLLFDRSHNNIRVLTQENDGQPYYQFYYNAEDKFPADIRYRATLVDYDNDGRKDLWTYGIGGLKVYRNVGDAVNGLQWELKSDLLYSEYVNGTSQLYVSSSDIPAIVDVDGDGDIDVLTFNQGGETVEYHQNQSMELYGVPDSLIYELKNECWGLFKEDFNTNFISLNDQSSPCVGGGIPNPLKTEAGKSAKHSGSTLLALDIDNSGVLDLILGDVSYPTMTLLKNGGSAPNTNSAMVTQDNFFPSNTTAIDIQLFPAAFFVDVDFDGVKDLVVCPNARNIPENETSVRFYKNNGTNILPNFVYASPNYFQKEMIEHGTGTIPVLFDVNEDGLKDLIIANTYRYIPTIDKESTIAYYRNTGTASAPVYTYVDYNYLDLDQQNYGLRSIPAFGDIDNDGDEDLFMGIENGTIVFYENTSTGSGAIFNTAQSNYPDNNGNPITTEGFSHPQLFDLDQDGLLDLILGSKSGKVHYYRNIGTSSSPSFQLENTQLGNVSVVGLNPNALAAPHFFRDDNTTYLFVGSVDGKLFFYDSIENNIGSGNSFNLVSPEFLGLNVEAYSSFCVEDIDGDGNLNMFVGQDLGGIFHFEVDPNSSASLNEVAQEQIALYPNPGTKEIVLSSSLEIETIRIVSIQGKEVLKQESHSSIETIDVTSLNSGTYLVFVEFSNGNRGLKKWIKL